MVMRSMVCSTKVPTMSAAPQAVLPMTEMTEGLAMTGMVVAAATTPSARVVVGDAGDAVANVACPMVAVGR